MRKVKTFIENNQENLEKISLQAVNNMSLEAKMNSLNLSSFGGLSLLRAEEHHLALGSQLASCVKDTRAKHLVRHSIEELFLTRIFQVCLGYEDVNDCDRNRSEPMMQLALEHEGFDKDLCSSATMCRFENMVTEEDLLRIQEMFVTMFILSYEGKQPKYIILDCDDTNVNAYGSQEGILFNGYYDDYCFMPFLVFEGYSGRMILPLLKPGRRNKTANVADTLEWLVLALRAAWPETLITVRGDSHFCSHEFMDWAFSQKKVFFITGLAANSVLLNYKGVQRLSSEVQNYFEEYHAPCKRYCEFLYKANTWRYHQRVIAKVEITETGGLNIRFVVTNVSNKRIDGIYEKLYCQRGKDELYIRQFKEAVNGDRLSCHSFNANRLRIFIHAAAYILLHSLRMRALKNTSLERASLLTIREKLLLFTVNIKVLKSKIVLEYAKNHPMWVEFYRALQFYQQAA